MDQPFEFVDDLGPAKVVYISESTTGLKAIVVIDNVAKGPSIGGARMAPDVDVRECARLARAMTLKNAAAGLPHGGGKSVIFGDPHISIEEKERLIRNFAAAIRDLPDYIVGPDMGTDETCMAWIYDEIGRAVGLPAVLGGIPLDQIGATGFGLSVSAEIAQNYCDLNLNGARVVVQGFGAVGKHAARFLAEQGAVLVAAADSRGTVVNQQGISIERLIELKDDGRSVLDYQLGEHGEPEAVVDVECDIWIPAARPDVIRVDNVGRLKTRLVVQGANIPVTPDAEVMLHQRGILSIPDFIANAGGVICASTEYHGGTESAAFEEIRDRVGVNTALVLERASELGAPPREVALKLAEQRVREAMHLRRWA